jgi:tetratricopeptide (TPR) repeat protein
MSLINQLLKDLEKRRAENKPDSDLPTSGLSSSEEIPKSGKFKRNFILLCILFVALIVIIYFQFFSTSSPLSQAKKHLSKTNSSVSITPSAQQAEKKAATEQTTTPAAEPQKQAAITPAEQTTKKPAEAKQQAPAQTQQQVKTQAKTGQSITSETPNQEQPISISAIIENVQITNKDKMTTIAIKLSNNAHYQIQRGATPDEFKLILDNTDLNHKTFSVPSNSAIKTISAKNVSGDLIINFALSPESTIGSIDFNKTAPSTLTLTLANPNVTNNAGAETEVSVKSAVESLSKEQKAKMAYDKAVALLANDDIDGAVQKLTPIVLQDPNYTLARMTLVKLLIKQNHLTSARHYINEGLAETPDNVDLVILQARLYYLRGHPKAALSALENVAAPPIETNPEYYAFTAALQQKLGHVAIAAQLYKQLINLNPGDAKSWLGLAIAYETADKNNAARAAYQRALSAGGLSPNLQAYITTKINQLGGE